MAFTFTVNDELVTFPTQLASVDPSGNVQQIGAITFKTIDITEYEASAAAIIPASDLGLKVIYGCNIKEAELSANVFTATPSATGDQIVIVGDIAASGVELGAVNCGELNFISWGELPQSTENV